MELAQGADPMTRLRRTLTRLLAALLAALALAPSTIGTAGAVVNGRVAPDGVLQRDWYFYAQIELNGATWCGGSVISINSVLTAAHCVDGTVRADQLTVVLESVLAPEGGEIRRDVAAIEIEPSWTGSTGIDLAILRLENEVDEIGLQSSPVPGNYVTPLAEGDRQAGDIADVAGRGLTSRGGSASADVKEARMEIVADADCNVNPSLGNRQVCFQPHSDHDASGLTCNGDSGGPITTWNHARQSFVLFAVVNMGNCT
ncbi:MAG: trypsin-like serine protease, partial [Acidimicrobiales bacterium]